MRYSRRKRLSHRVSISGNLTKRPCLHISSRRVLAIALACRSMNSGEIVVRTAPRISTNQSHSRRRSTAAKGFRPFAPRLHVNKPLGILCSALEPFRLPRTPAWSTYSGGLVWSSCPAVSLRKYVMERFSFWRYFEMVLLSAAALDGRRTCRMNLPCFWQNVAWSRYAPDHLHLPASSELCVLPPNCCTA